MKKLGLLLLLAIAMVSCGKMAVKNKNLGTPIANAELFDTSNTQRQVGTANFFALQNGDIKMVLNIHYPQRANKSVAVHFHEHGDCGDKGNNTHGHWNPTKQKHGQWGIGEFHSGDIGNIGLDANGVGSVTISTNKWSIDSNNANNIIGRGIIMHSGVDDYTTQPTGNSGARVGCGVIQKL